MLLILNCSSYVLRSNTTEDELNEMTKTTNPDEINIDEDYSTDEDEEIEGKLSYFDW